MIKSLVFAGTLAILPVTAFAQSSGVIVRDPTGGATRDPALVAPAEAPAMKRDPAGGSMIDDTPRFRAYVIEQRLPSYSYAQPVAVGTILPSEGVVYRQVPAGYGVQGYNYTVVNDRMLVVEPGTRRIVQIIE